MKKGFSCFLIVLFAFSIKAQNTITGTGVSNSSMLNTIYGYYAGAVNNSTANCFFGHNSGNKNTTGDGNVFIGYRSGFSNSTGYYNVFLGTSAGDESVSGYRNTYLGCTSASGGTGNENTFIGFASGRTSKGNSNTYIGTNAGNSSGTGSGNVFLGYSAGYNEQLSNKLYIDNSSTTIPLIFGDFSANQLAVNIRPISTHTLTVGGTIHATGIYVNGQSITSAGFEFWTKVGTNIWNNSGNVGIGTTLANNPNKYRLAVAGKFGAHEVQIENNSLTWPDFVFNKDYKLTTLNDLEEYIKVNKHLPEIPTEKEVKENGLLVSEMNAKLLQKIEELTLYVIELKKEVDALKDCH